MKLQKSFLAILAAVLPACLSYAYFADLGVHGTQFEDSYITYRYALNLAAGNGLVFSPGDLADSASSFLYTVVLAVFVRLGVADLEVVGAGLGMASVGAIGFMLYHHGVRAGLKEPMSVLWALVLVGIGIVPLWGTLGMETPLFAALLVGASLALFVKGERRWWVVASWLTVVALARPEGYLLCIFYGLSRLPWRELKPWVSVNGWARIISDQAGAILATAVVLAFFIVKAHYYDGVWFSQAYWLKKVGIYYQPRAFYMAASLVVRCGVVFAIAAWWLLCGLVRGEVLWVYALAAVYAVLCVIGPFEELIRYLMPVTALVSLLVVDGAARYGDSAKDVVLGRGSRRRAQILMMLALIVQGAATTVWFRNGHIMVADIQRCRIEVGHWLRNHAQPGDLILSTDVGGLGYASWPTQIVDIFGLTSRWPYDAIMSGRSFDEALAGRTAVFIADTFRKPESEDQQARVLPIYFANGAFIVARPESRLRWEIGAALKVCRQSRVPDVSIEVRPVRL